MSMGIGARGKRLAAMSILLTLSGMASADNLVVNGDFSAGNSGFTSGYQYASPMYWQPTHYSTGALVFADHTGSDVDSLLMVDGAYNATTVVWQETFSVAPNTDYQFDAWARSVMRGAGPVITLDFTANGSSLGTLTLTNYPDDLWQSFSSVWNSGASTSLTLRVFDLQTNNSVPGNDFALDDISLSPVPETDTWAMFLAGLGVIGLVAARGRPHFGADRLG